MGTEMKKVKIATIILAIVLIALVAFGGVYIKTQNRMENKVKDYDFGRELKGGRVVELTVVKEEGTNTENLTPEKYEIVKKTIIERLKNFGAQDYNIALNQENGTIIVELPENTNTDGYVYLLTAPTKIQMKEKDTEIELLNDAMVEKAEYSYNVISHNVEIGDSYQVYLLLNLTSEGQVKFEEIKNNYAIFADEVSEIEKTQEEAEKETENTEVEGTSEETTNTETKKISVLTVGGTEYDIEKIDKNKLWVKIGGETTSNATLNKNVAAAGELATLISSGKYPVEYEITDNRFVYSDITNEQITYFAIAIAIVMLVVFVIFTIKYKTKGLLASISCIGFVAILSLLLRYTNVNISIEGIGGIILVLIINFIINQNMIEKANSIDYKEICLKLVPITIITLVFCFAGWSNLSSFGMIMFWGLVLILGYNTVVTKTLLKFKESK